MNRKIGLLLIVFGLTVLAAILVQTSLLGPATQGGPCFYGGYCTLSQAFNQPLSTMAYVFVGLGLGVYALGRKTR